MARSNISFGAIPSALQKLNRRLTELNELGTLEPKDDISHTSKLIADKVNATLDEVFGQNTVDADEFWIQYSWFWGSTNTWEAKKDGFARGRERTIACVKTAIQRLEEKLADADEDPTGKALRAYQGLALHPNIAGAASQLYLDGHFSNAVQDAVKALNNLVRLQSGLMMDGTSLMEKAFNPSNPVIKFNALSTQSDRDEQKGFMMMFSGAVSGLRNPRAHEFIHDDPERALEFIAFVSLLAKLLDEAKK